MADRGGASWGEPACLQACLPSVPDMAKRLPSNPSSGSDFARHSLPPHTCAETKIDRIEEAFSGRVDETKHDGEWNAELSEAGIYCTVSGRYLFRRNNGSGAESGTGHHI